MRLIQSLGIACLLAGLAAAQTQAVRTFPLNGYKRQLDGQWQGIRYASDGKVYFASSTHSGRHGASFFKYDPVTGQVTLLAEDITRVCGEDPLTNPQGKLHSDVVEANGWLYLTTHFSSELPGAYATWTGSHLLGYELATGNFRDYGVVHPNYTSYSGIGVDPARNYVYVFVTGQELNQVSYIYRIHTVTGVKTNLGQVGGPFNPSFWMFVDRRGDVWFSLAHQNGDLRRVRGESGQIDVFPNALPPLVRFDSPALAPASEQAHRWIMWMQPLDGDRAVFTLGWYGGMIYLFDSSKPIGSGQEFQALRHIGPTDVGVALGGNRVFYYQRAGRQFGNQGFTDFHLLSVSLDASTGYAITDHGLLRDQDGRLVWRVPSMMTDGQNRVFMTGDWWTIAGDLGSLRYNYSNGVESYVAVPRGEFFGFADVGAGPPAGTLSISSLTPAAVTETSAVIQWSTNRPASEQVDFGTTVAYGQSTPAVPANSAIHAVPLTGLTPDTTYYVRAVSVDGSESATATTTFRTSRPPLAIANARAGAITRNSAVISWDTNRAANAQVFYGVSPAYGSQTAAGVAQSTAHSVPLSGLLADTLYYVKAVSIESGGGSATAEGVTFRTAPASVTISNVQISNLTPNAATITWTTSVPATDLVSYGTTVSYRSGSIAGTTPSTSHSATITGLSPWTSYFARIVSTDALGAAATVEALSFRTLQTPLQITELTSDSITATGALIRWRTTRAASAQISYGPTTAYGVTVALPTLRTSSYLNLTGLTAGTTYYLRLRSQDADGLTAEATRSFTTTGGGTAITPLLISSVQAGAISQTSATITWTTNAPANRQVEFGLTTALGSATAVNTPLASSHAVPLPGLTANTTYHFKVISIDAAGRTASSPISSFTTLPAAPPPPDLSLSNVQAGGVTQNSAVINWTSNLGANARVNYGTTPALGQSSVTGNLANATSHAITLAGLAAATTYYYQAVSVDALGRSASSPVLTFDTLAGPPPGYVLTASPATIRAGATVTIAWTAGAGRTAADWLGLYQVGATNRQYNWYALTRGAATGSISVVIRTPGQYEFRYLLNGGYTDAGRSGTITVTP